MNFESYIRVADNHVLQLKIIPYGYDGAAYFSVWEHRRKREQKASGKSALVQWDSRKREDVRIEEGGNGARAVVERYLETTG